MWMVGFIYGVCKSGLMALIDLQPKVVARLCRPMCGKSVTCRDGGK